MSVGPFTAIRSGSLGRWAGPAWVGVLLLTTVAALSGCGGTSGGPDQVQPESSPGVFDPAAGSRMFPPGSGAAAERDGVPVVVLVPGGGWSSADPGGLVPLAESLSARGAAVVTVTYRTSSDGAYFPVPVEDVACDVAYAVGKVVDSGVAVGEVVLVGHSAGAQLAALAALRPPVDLGCGLSPVAVDRMVGLAGPYDVTRVPELAVALFGPDRQDVATWSEGNPVTHADLRPEVPVLLVHGRADAVVPLAFSEQFAAALEAGGHDVTERYLDGVDHQSVYAAEVAGPIIGDWLGLPAG